MKKFCTVVAALAVLVSCQKQPSEEEKKAEVEKQVQERLAAEHQTQEQQRLAQQQADLAAREKGSGGQGSCRCDNCSRIDAAEERNGPERQHRHCRNFGTAFDGFVWDFLSQARTLRRLARDLGLRLRLATARGGVARLEAVHRRSLGLYGRRLDLGFRRAVSAGRLIITGDGSGLRRVGWVWVPGEEWAPAWVSWRTSKDYVGWAPLPPEARFDRKRGIHNWADNYYDIGPDQYAFVPGNEFGARRVQTSVVPVERNVTIVIDTTNVTNITYSNTTVVNQGPNYEEMRSRSKQPIERYRLQRQVEMTSDTSKPIVRGEVLEMSAPVITRVPGIDRPQRIKETLTEATVEKTWTAETDRAASERARTKMKAEVTPPPDAPSKRFVRPTSVTVSTTRSLPSRLTPPPAAVVRHHRQRANDYSSDIHSRAIANRATDCGAHSQVRRHQHASRSPVRGDPAL